MVITTDALVLRTRNYRENDRQCLLLTEKLGPVYAYAHGARSLRNKNFAATTQFACGQYTLTSRGDSYTVTESGIEQVFGSIQTDLDRLALAQYLCELAGELAPPDENSAAFLRLMRGALGYLSAGKRPNAVIKAACELRMLSMAGYMPDLVMCASCGAYEADVMYFSPAAGNIVCAECGSPAGAVALGRGAVEAMRHCLYVELSKVFSFTLPEPSLSQLGRAAERYLLARVERGFTTLDFLRSLAQPTPESQ